MENALLLAAVLKDTRKRIKQMFLTFNSSVQDSVMECIAQSDRHHLVQSVKVCYCDLNPISNNIVIAPSAMSVLQHIQQCPASIRYQEGSQAAKEQAEILAQQLKVNNMAKPSSKMSPVEVIFVDRAQNTYDNYLISLNTLQLARDLKNLDLDSKITLKTGDVPFSYFTMSSAQSRDLLYLDCLQVLDRVSEFKKFFGAFQQSSESDLQAKLEQMEQQNAYRTELNEFKNVGQFITEEKDSILFL